MATVISSRALQPRIALHTTAIAEFAASLIFGVAVTTTVGKDLIEPSAVSQEVIIAAVLSAVLWDILTWFIGIPSSIDIREPGPLPWYQ